MAEIMKNGRLYDRNELNIPEGFGLIYEVIRIMDRTPLFFHEHYQRFADTAGSRGITDAPSKAEFREMLDRFLQAFAKDDYNIKIIFAEDTRDLYIYENPSSYPEEILYLEGIHTELMVYQRENPTAKITNPDLTTQANALREKTGAYEVLLVDPSGFVTEGSRSNVFFIKDGSVHTPPLKSVLPGVTRQLIIKTCQAMKVNVIETDINSEDLHTYEGAFISGTSPKILPVRNIGELELASAALLLLKDIMAGFDRTIQNDLETYRK